MRMDDFVADKIEHYTERIMGEICATIDMPDDDEATRREIEKEIGYLIERMVTEL